MEPNNNIGQAQPQPENPVSVPLNPPVTSAPPEPVIPVPPTFIPPTPPTPLTPPPAPPTPEPTFIPPVVIAPPAPTASMPPVYTSTAEAPTKSNSWKTFFLILLGMVVIGVAICAFIGYSQ